MLRRLLLLTVLLAGCNPGERPAPASGDGGARQPLASFRFEADATGALWLAGCATCAAYPNVSDCEVLSIEVGEDGAACGRCTQSGAVIDLGCNSLSILMCKAAAGCVVCHDLHGTQLVDTCTR